MLQVERGDSARRHLMWWLETARLAGLKSDNKTELILFTHPSSVSQLPFLCRAVREDVQQAWPCLFKALPVSSQSDQGSHRHLLHTLAGPESSFLLRYDTVIRADLHSLPSPALHHLEHLQPDEVLVSRTASSPPLTSVEEAVCPTAAR